MTNWTLKSIGLTPYTKRLTPGDLVQEHIWVRTCQVLWDGKFYFGILEDDAKTIEGLKAGQSVQFWPHHIAKVAPVARDDR